MKLTAKFERAGGVEVLIEVSGKTATACRFALSQILFFLEQEETVTRAILESFENNATEQELLLIKRKCPDHLRIPELLIKRHSPDESATSEGGVPGGGE